MWVQGSSATTIVVDRQVAYGSVIDPSKSALLPGQTSTSANFTNRAGGLTDILIDVDGLGNASALGVSDFEFRVGNSGTPSTWSLLAASPTLSVVGSGGLGGADRIQLNWSTGLIENTWLQIRLLATGNSGLSTADEFYFGHSFGDVNGDGALTAADPLSIINEINAVGVGPVDVTSPFDINRDGSLTAADSLLLINALNAGGHDSLASLTAPTSSGGTPGNGGQPVPEPPILALLASGIIALRASRRHLI